MTIARCSGSIERRGLLRGGLSLGALTMLTGCDVGRHDRGRAGAPRQISAFNDGVQAALFDPDQLAPEYPASQVLKPPRFNAYYDVEDVKPVDGDVLAARTRRPRRRQAALDASRRSRICRSAR